MELIKAIFSRGLSGCQVASLIGLKAFFLQLKTKILKKASLLKNNKIFEIKNIKNSLKITYPQIVIFKADQEKLSDVRDVIESFYFYDVKKSLDSYPDNLPTLSYVTKGWNDFINIFCKP
jgi:hypothetical protein